MLERYINRYLTNTLARCFNNISIKYEISTKVVIKKGKAKVYAKQRQFEDVYYKRIMTFRIEDAILYLCNFNKTVKEFEELLKNDWRGL